MKSVDEIKKNIKTCDWFISSHKQQIDLYLNEYFDIDKVEEYSRKIKLLEVERDALKWVLGEDE